MEADGIGAVGGASAEHALLRSRLVASGVHLQDVASCTIEHLFQTPRSVAARATFAGDSYYSSSATPASLTFEIRREATSATVTPLRPAPAGPITTVSTPAEESSAESIHGVSPKKRGFFPSTLLAAPANE